MIDYKQQREAGMQFCKNNLAECCHEILEWHETAILRDGKVRELAGIFYFAEPHALSMAEEAVKTEAMKFVLLINSEVLKS